MPDVRRKLRAHGVAVDPHLDVDPRGLEQGDTLAGHARIGIDRPDHYASDARLDDRLDARSRAPHVTTRLERHHHRCALGRVAGAAQGDDLGVGLAGRLRVTLAQRSPRARRRRAPRPRDSAARGVALAPPRPSPWTSVH